MLSQSIYRTGEDYHVRAPDSCLRECGRCFRRRVRPGVVFLAVSLIDSGGRRCQYIAARMFAIAALFLVVPGGTDVE